VGYDANKKIRGRKRHPVTDTLGLLLAVQVQPADVQDGHGGVDVLVDAVRKYSSIKTLFADAAYVGRCAATMKERTGVHVEVVRRSDDPAGGLWQGPGLPVVASVPGFKPLPKRWVIERTHAWNSRRRRLAKDFDQRCDVAEAWIWLIQGLRLLHLLAEPDEPERCAEAA
jgi:transposase